MQITKRVLLVRNAYSFDFGGGERYPVNLAIELQKNNIDPVVASSHEKILQLSNESGVVCLTMPWLKYQNFSGHRISLLPLYLLWQLRLLFWYLRIIKSERIDVLHIQSRDDFIAGTIAGRMLKKTVIWTDHADLKYIFKNIRLIYKNPISKIIYSVSRYARAIIIVSRNEEALIQGVLDGKSLDNSIVVYNGVTDSLVLQKRNFAKDVTVFSLTSRLVDTKGITEILSASDLLAKDGLDHRVLLIGEGPDEVKYKKSAGKSVVFMGFPKDALSYVAGSDIFVHPTYNEAFSLSLVEAAMLCKPVITTAVGGNPEIIKNRQTGLLIKPGDTNGLYDAMKELALDKISAHKYSINLRKSYEKSFQFDRIVREQIIPLYNSSHEDTR